MFSTLASGAKSLGLRFSLTGLLPFGLLTAYFFGLYAIAVAPSGAGVIEAINASARRVGVTGFVLLLMISLVLAVVSQPFQIGVVRFLEGYWGASALGDRARSFGVELQRRRQHVLKLRFEHFEESERYAAADYLGQRLQRYPEEGDRYLPTVLGNTLRAGEDSAGARYSLDTGLSWPRLYYCLPESIHRDVADLNQQIDGGARMTLALGISGVAGLPVLLHHGWWNLLTLTLLVLAAVAYRGAVSAARLLRPVLESAYDLHRFDMLKALHIRLPANPRDERATNRKLSAFLARESRYLLDGRPYSHRKIDRKIDTP